MKKIIVFLLVVCLFLFGILVLKGPGSTWACKNGEWIKFGLQVKEKPDRSCGIIDSIKGNILTFTENYRTNSKLLNTKKYNNRDLDKVPPELLFMNDAIVIRLNNNRISYLPKGLFSLEKVKELYLDHNNLTTIPAEIGNLSNLEVLSVSNNILKEIPKEIGKLKNLKRLDLSNNDIKDVPDELFDLKDNLKRLDIYGNSSDVDFVVKLQENLPNTSINF